jgi:hypothetical protein
MRGKKLLVIPLTVICSVVGTLFFYFILENIDRWFPTPSLIKVEPWLPIIGSIIALSCAYLLVFSIWHRRAGLLAYDKKAAYQRALIPGLAGMSSLLTNIIHVYDPLDMFPAGFISVPPPANPLTTTLASSLWNLLGLPCSTTAHLFQEILGIAVAVFGLLMVVRGFEVLGIDYATVVYLYYPEESKLVDHKITALYGTRCTRVP